VGTKDDIAFTALFLASPAASFISGDTIVVDGGVWLARSPFIPPGVYQAVRAQRSPSAKL
jgi:2,4-dienoyl-CoA reductase [(3E)-enoyl-CoA-producing], peroxisomal